MQLTYLDWFVVLLYLIGTMAIGLWVGAYVKTGRDFFLAGRSLPWWAIGFSLVATDIGGTDLIGVGGGAYRYGMAIGSFEWIGCVPAMIVAAFIFIPHFWRCQITTIPEFMERRFNVELRTALAFCWLLFMACNLGVMLLASAKMMQTLAGWDPVYSILVTAALVGVYTFAGGLAAVVYTDVLQGIVMIGGCTMVVLIGIAEVGGVEAFRQKVHEAVQAREKNSEANAAALAEDPEFTPDAAAELRPLPTPDPVNPAPESDHWSLVLPADTKSPFPWPGILFGLAFIISPAYWIGNQSIVQRGFGARTEYDASAAYVFGAVVKNIIPLIIVIPGLLALAQFPFLNDPDQALPRIISDLLPAGMRGLFLAAFLAALMSSVDSYVNSAAAIVTNDFYQRFLRPQADQRQILFVGRFTTVALIVWGVFFAWILMESTTSIYILFQTMMSFFSGPAFAMLLCGVLSRRINGGGAFVGFLAGVVMAVSLHLLNQPLIAERLALRPMFQIQDPILYYPIWGFFTSLAVAFLVSPFTRPDSAERLKYVLSFRRGEGLP